MSSIKNPDQILQSNVQSGLEETKIQGPGEARGFSINSSQVISGEKSSALSFEPWEMVVDRDMSVYEPSAKIVSPASGASGSGSTASAK